METNNNRYTKNHIATITTINKGDTRNIRTGHVSDNPNEQADEAASARQKRTREATTDKHVAGMTELEHLPGKVDVANAQRTAKELAKLSQRIQEMYERSGNLRRSEKEQAIRTINKWRGQLSSSANQADRQVLELALEKWTNNTGQGNEAHTNINICLRETHANGGDPPNKQGENRSVRVRAGEDETFAQVLAQLRAGIELGNLEIAKVSKAAASNDLIIKMSKQGQAQEMAQRLTALRAIGVEVMGPRTKKIHIRGMDDPTTEDEIKSALAKYSKVEDIRIVFKIPG